jgi:hypothetical protein
VIRKDVQAADVGLFETRGKEIWNDLSGGKATFESRSKGEFNAAVNCPAVLLIEEVFVEPLAPTRTARIVIYRDKNADGTHIGPTVLKPPAEFHPPKTWKVPGDVMTDLTDQNTKFMMEFAPGEPPDADANGRMIELFKVLDKAGVVVKIAGNPDLVALKTPADRSLLDVSGKDVKVNDIVFLRRG